MEQRKPQPWRCRKCDLEWAPDVLVCSCGTKKRLTGADRRKIDRAAALEEARRAGNLWGAVEPPPVGCDAVAEWLNQVNAAVGRAIEQDFPDQIKIRTLQTLLKTATRAKNRENAPHREKLLQAREAREGMPYLDAALGAEPPADVQVLPLWWYYRLCRAIYEVAQEAEVNDDQARKWRALNDAAQAGVYLREQHKAEAFTDEHGIRDVHKLAKQEARVWPVIETESRPAPVGVPVLFSANPGPQSAFVDSTVDEILYGGRAGGGKSAGLAIAALDCLFSYADPRNQALIVRRTWTETTRQSYYKMCQLELGKLQRRGYGVRWHGDLHFWEIEGYGQLYFGYLDSLNAALQYQGGEYCFFGIDESTHIPPEALEFVARTRMRTRPGKPPKVRYTSNPGGPYHRYFFEEFAPWLNRKAEYLEAASRGVVPLAGPGEVLWYVMEAGKLRWVPAGTPGAKSRTYIPATVENTPQYDVEEYQRQLNSIRDPLLLVQMRDGDWSAEHSAGEVFRRPWFKVVSTLPRKIVRLVRSWDMAWGTSDSACWTVGVLMGEMEGGGWAILDILRMRGTEGTTRPSIRRVAEIDGRGVIVRLPADMGLAGQVLRDNFVSELAGFDVRMVPDKGDKFARARPYAAQCEYGHVYLVAGSHPTRELAAELSGAGTECSTGYEWIDGYITELENADPRYPKRGFVDQMDASVGAFEFLHTDRSQLPAPGSLRGASEAIQRAFGVGAAHAAPPAASWAPSVARGGGGRRTGMI